jgi:hypothetical protein
MADDARKPTHPLPGPLPGALLVCLLTACQAGPARAPEASEPSATSTAESGVRVSEHLEALDGMTPGDTLRQQATLLGARSAWQQAQTPANVLRYALVLGTPGHDDSNPLEASRLLAGLLAAPEGLSTDELRLATAFQREFTARVQQYADLARTRIDADTRMRATEAEAQARVNAMSADLARLRRERDTIQQKLDAIADIEKSLMERDDGTAASPGPTPP